MRKPASPSTLSVGVAVPSQLDEAGEYLADARALEAAGADSIWADRRAGVPGHDPWMLLAGIAAVTSQVRIALPLVPADWGDRELLAQRLATLDRLSRGRMMISIAGAADEVPEVISLARGIGQFPLLLETGDGDFLESSLDEEPPCPHELWARVALPAGRDAWRAALRTSAEAGATGVLVPFGPRLLDLLRRPDEEDDRSDLLVAQG